MRVANIDNYILNSDRNSSNPNILYSKDSGKYYAIDYGMALLDHRVYEAIKENHDISKYMMSIKNCNITKRNYYLLKGEKKILIRKSFKAIVDIINGIISECPKEWEPIKYRVQIIDLIASRILNRGLFKNSKCPEELYL